MTYVTLNELAAFTLEDVEKSKVDLALIMADAGLVDCPIIYCSDAFIEHGGYASSEIIGRNCCFMQGKETEAESIEAFRTAVSTRVPVEVQITMGSSPIKEAAAPRMFMEFQRITI